MNGRRAAGGEDSDVYWGTVDGFKLLRMKKDWLEDEYKQYYDQGDGEWFVTICLCAGMELEYAVPLRSSVVRLMGLDQLNGKEEINDALSGKFRAKWNWNEIRQLTIDITEGKAPLPNVQCGRWVQTESLPSGLQKYYQNGRYTYIPFAKPTPVPAAPQRTEPTKTSKPAEPKPPEKTLEQHIQEGFSFIEKKKPKEAVQHFRGLLKTHPEDTGVLFVHAKAQVAYAEMVSHKQKIK